MITYKNTNNNNNNDNNNNKNDNNNNTNNTNFDRKKARAKEEKGLHSTATGKSRILFKKAKILQSNQMFRRIIKNTLGGSTYNKHCTFDQFPMKISKSDKEVTNQARIRLLWDEQVYYDKVRN